MVNERLAILRLLLENSGKEFSIRQIAGMRGINYKTAYEGVKKLESEGLLDVKNHGNISLCSFNRNYNESVYLVEYQRREELLKNKNFKVLHNRLKGVPGQFILLLFGSQAKKTQSRHSDIDLLLISNNPKPIQEEVNLLPLKIHLTEITYLDFMEMLKSREKTVVSEALKNNIIMFSIEDYYRLQQNASG